MQAMYRLMMVGALLALSGFGLPQQSSATEYNVKAVFLFNFAQFVSWPESAFTSANAPLVIGILGDDPFGTYLDKTVRNEKVNGHPLEVRRFKDATDAKGTHILFINLPKADKLEKALGDLEGQNTLTVGDTPNFAKSGGMIRFFMDNSKIRIRVNLDEVKDADLTISSKLLKLAEVIQNGKVQ